MRGNSLESQTVQHTTTYKTSSDARSWIVDLVSPVNNILETCIHRLRPEILELLNTASCNEVVSHGAPIGGYLWFLQTTHVETHINKMRPWSSHTLRHFTCIYLHIHVDAGDIRTWPIMFILITGRPEYPQLKPHAKRKMALILEFPV